MPEYHAMRALELVREAQSGRVSAQELAEYFLRRIERYDQSLGLNAVGELNPQALDEAKALEENASPRDFPLFGLPILVKDNIDVAGLHTTAGSPALADNLARRDAPIVANLRRAGAVVLGKTHMTEFANYTALDMPNGYSALAGQVHSAYGAQCDPGGSSTGSAVAVSAGFCAVAIGTDTSFSIVGCAAEHGIVGLKPACGALISAGIVPISHTLDSAGPMARDVASALAVYAAMRGVPATDCTPLPARGLRLAVNWAGEEAGPAQRQRYAELIEALRSAGAQVCEIEQPGDEPGMEALMQCEFREDLEAYLAEHEVPCKTLASIVRFYEAHPATCLRYGMHYLQAALAAGRSEARYAQALERRAAARERVLQELKDVDACLMAGWSDIMHFAGLPSIALPLGMAQDGTPRGMILYGTDETRLLRAALAMETFAGPIAPPPVG